MIIRHSKNHEKALAPVLAAFRAIDKARRGVLDKDQFCEFCSSINNAISRREVLVLLKAMDPGGAGAVTFSSCASVLATELENMMLNS
jgi:Ca2+-binding EF-hand superfamily protein